MALSTKVIVNSIKNLSDARFCAGMGVDMLGFRLEEQDPDYITPSQVKEIAAWVSGVYIVGEFYEKSPKEINTIAEELNLDYVQLCKPYLISQIDKLQKPVIQKIYVNKDTCETTLMEFLNLYKDHVAYFLVYTDDFKTIDETNLQFLKDLSASYPLILGFGIEKDNVLSVLDNIKPIGIGLTGGEEIRPGYKDFDTLQEIFELIEVEEG